jgi:hypothetical protein
VVYQEQYIINSAKRNFVLKSIETHCENRIRWLWVFLALLPFITIPILGSLFYFRHDDSAILLWAKEFTKPFYFAFSTDLNVNEYYKYPGMGAYWRPCIYLYVKLLWLLFGANPAPYFIVGGILFMIAVYSLFKIAENISGTELALLSCLFLFVTFQNMMFNLFHIGVAATFFYQLGMIYFFLSFLRKGKWAYFIGVIVFLVPAMVRQTTPVILTTILVITTLTQTARIKILSIKFGITLIIVLIGFYIMTFSSISSSGSIFSVFPDISQMWTFIYERLLYYGTILTNGIVGIIIVSGFTVGFIHHLSSVVKGKFPFKLLNKWAWSILTLFMVVLLLLFKNISIYWLTASILYLFMFDEKLRLPLGWAGTSLLSFLSAGYYHNGYLLEAGFPLSLALGIIVTNITAPYMPLFLAIKKKISRRELLFIVSCILIGCFFLIGIVSRINILQEKFEVIKVSIDSNRNFKQLMDYLQHKMPQNAVIYELSEVEIGTTRFDRRFLPFRERALRIKIMDIEDTLVMLKILDRADIHLYPSSELDLSAHSGEKYFIALNNFERKIAEDKFLLELIKEFKTNHDSTAVYRITSIGDRATVR